MKKMLVILTLISGFVFSQDYEMPGLGLYVGGVMGTIGGDLAETFDAGITKSPSFSLLSSSTNINILPSLASFIILLILENFFI